MGISKQTMEKAEELSRDELIEALQIMTDVNACVFKKFPETRDYITTRIGKEIKKLS